MAGDFSRNTFDPRKHYSGVLMQQGRVQLDADWNEQQAIQQHHLETTARDVIGPSGAPSRNPGFAIKPLESGNFQIDPGHYYVDGILCENEAAVPYSGQPDLPAAQPLTTGFYLVYLDVWHRLITALDDPLIREVALGGPDTTTRLKTVWQVRVLPVSVKDEADALQKTEFAEWSTLIAPNTGKLNARTISFAESEPCVLPPSSGYRRLENQLYRVEIHRGGDHEQATFKWSRENASITTGIQKITGNVITVTDLGKDEILGFAVGQWVEIVDDEAELMQAPYSLAQIAKTDPSTREITLFCSSEMTSLLTKLDGKPGLKLRRWDQAASTTDNDGLKIKADNWTELEGGIQVQFSNGSYRSGDYWLIPARTATGDIEWPRDSTKPESIPLFQSPAGIRHHYCRLALLRFDGTKLSVLKDCRQIFPPATEVTADYIGYTPNCNPDPQTVAAFLDTLFYRKEDKELAPLIRALLSLNGRDVTVREGLNWLAEALERRTGMVTVGEGGCYEDLTKAFEALASTKDYEVALLLLPGEHKLPANYTTPDKCSSIKLEGAGTRASTIQLNGNLTLKADEIILRDLTIQATRNRQSITLEGEKITATRCSFNKNINNFLAARILGNTQKYGESSLTVNSLAVDKDNNILVAGIFLGTVNFGDDKLTSWENDIFVAKYDPELKHLKSLALTNMQHGNTLSVKDMAVDDQGNILVTGQLLGTIKFKFYDSDSYLSSAKEDGFIAKLNSELGYSKLRLLAKTEFYVNSMVNVVANARSQEVAATVIGRSGIFVGNAAQDRGAIIMRNLVEKEWMANLLSFVDPSVSLSPASMLFKPNGSTTGEISVTATGNWSIEVEKNVDWINLMPPSSQSGDKTKVSYSGNATVKYTVLPNWDSISRTTTLRIASSLSKATLAQFTITQAGLSVTPTEIPFVVQGGSGDIKVSAPPGWEAKSNVDWIKISAVDNGVDGLVRYQVLKNTGQNLDTNPRTGTMTIARQTVTIKQMGGSLSLDRLSDSFDQNGGGPRTVQVVKATPGHEWEAKPSPLDTWIVMQSGAKGIGDGSFSYSVNSLPTGLDVRRSIISVNSQTFSITQQRISPTETG